MLFARQIQFIESLESQLFQTIEQAFRDFGFELEEVIREEQLFNRGEDGRENKLLGYTRSTIRIKISKNQPADRTTLKDNGQFHESITITGLSDRFEVSSNVTHAKYLIRRYGEDILRPNLDSIHIFIEKNVLPNFKNKIDDVL